MIRKFAFLLGLMFLVNFMNAQVQDTIVEEDFSQYENVGFADDGAKRYCSPKIYDLSPQRLISVSWDQQLGYEAFSSRPGEYDKDDSALFGHKGNIDKTAGLRLFANIPIISKNELVWQMGLNFVNTNYDINSITPQGNEPNAELNNGMLSGLDARGLTSAGVHSTIFKPLGEKSFLLFQGSADLNGDYGFDDVPSLSKLRYSGAVIWGKRSNDRKQWGVGISRTYRVGEMNYIPVVMFNWTAPNRKYGTEILFPARANFRLTINPRNLILIGYELEGASYHLANLSNTNTNYELRRSELRAKVEYQRQIKGFVWFSAQAGWRNDYSFNVDRIEGDGDFFRGFFGNQKYSQLNSLTNPVYFNIGIHLVSP